MRPEVKMKGGRNVYRFSYLEIFYIGNLEQTVLTIWVLQFVYGSNLNSTKTSLEFS